MVSFTPFSGIQLLTRLDSYTVPIHELNLRIKTKPVTDGTDATLYLYLVFYTNISGTLCITMFKYTFASTPSVTG